VTVTSPPYPTEGRRMLRISLKALVPTVAPLLVVAAVYAARNILRRANCSKPVNLACLSGAIIVFDGTNWPASFIDER
jgi:hypothetical protein